MIGRSPIVRATLRLGAVATAAGVLLLVSVAPALADPGTPGLDRASTAVYEEGDQPPVLGGEGDGDTGPAVAGEGNGPAGEAGALEESLPFTGFSAALVLGAGLAALLLGLSLGAAARRLHRA